MGCELEWVGSLFYVVFQMHTLGVEQPSESESVLSLVGWCLCWTPQRPHLLPGSEQPSRQLCINPPDHQSLGHYLW